VYCPLEASQSTRSVNVPPVSMPIRIFFNCFAQA
jgi:hypothetical protein